MSPDPQDVTIDAPAAGATARAMVPAVSIDASIAAHPASAGAGAAVPGVNAPAPDGPIYTVQRVNNPDGTPASIQLGVNGEVALVPDAVSAFRIAEAIIAELRA